MRITNKIMQRNSITNLNRNKVLSDKLNNQLTLEKKITRPSDDPVIAIRSLRLNTSITQLTQYYEKNAPDASAWLQATEEAVNITSTVITDMYEQFLVDIVQIHHLPLKTPQRRHIALQSS